MFKLVEEAADILGDSRTISKDRANIGTWDLHKSFSNNFGTGTEAACHQQLNQVYTNEIVPSFVLIRVVEQAREIQFIDLVDISLWNQVTSSMQVAQGIKFSFPSLCWKLFELSVSSCYSENRHAHLENKIQGGQQRRSETD